MSTGDPKKWVQLQAPWHGFIAWHQLPGDGTTVTTLCGLPPPAGLSAASKDYVFADIASHRTIVCGRCEKAAEQTASRVSGDSKDQAGPSPERRAYLAATAAERLRRAERRAAEAAERKGREGGSSIRAASGGLPGLGKRR